jgi:hypothetical protein
MRDLDIGHDITNVVGGSLLGHLLGANWLYWVYVK